MWYIFLVKTFFLSKKANKILQKPLHHELAMLIGNLLKTSAYYASPTISTNF